MKKWIPFLFIPLFSFYSQKFKSDISVVQFSAPFTVDGEISLKPFRDYNTHRFDITESPEVFKKEKINFLPTVILYNNGKEIIRIESDITLSLPKNCSDTILYHIEKLIESKF